MHGALSGLSLFLVQLLLVIAASRALGLLTRRIGQPLVIAEVTAGILLGPSLLGWLAPEVSATLFPRDSLPALGLVSQLGLCLFMFVVGLRVDLEVLRSHSRASVAISHSSIVVPFALGMALGFFMLEPYGPGEGIAFPLFMSAAMAITAFPVLARILTESGLIHTRLGIVTMACAAVDDITAWCLLAFVIAASRADGFEGAALMTGLALAYVLIALFLLRPLLARLAARVERTGSLSQGLFAAVVGLALLSALTTEIIGIHALFGAFLIGLVIPKGVLSERLTERLEDTVTVILVPLFFAYSGLRTEIGLVDTGAEWAMTGLITLVACLGKFGGSAIAARVTGMSWREASAIGVLMNTRGLMELIVLNIGLDLKVISPTVFTMMVIMALVTTAMTSPLLVALRLERLGEPRS